MIGWARIVAGRWRDPLVGRDVLVGLASILVSMCVYHAGILGTMHGGGPPDGAWSFFESPRRGFLLAHLAGSQFTASSLLGAVSSGIRFAALGFFLLAMFRTLLRNRWVANGAFVVFAFVWASWEPGFRGWDWITVGGVAVTTAIYIVVALRYGLLVLVVGGCLGQFLESSVLTTDFSAWYGQSSLIAVLVVSALAIWAFRVSVGNPLLQRRAMKA